MPRPAPPRWGWSSRVPPLAAEPRLLGIDTPEVYGGVECGGEPASRKLKKQLPRNTRIMLISDRKQPLVDRYDRLLRYVMKGKVDTGKTQLRKGMAKVYVVGDRFTRYTAYKAAQSQAKRPASTDPTGVASSVMP